MRRGTCRARRYAGCGATDTELQDMCAGAHVCVRECVRARVRPLAGEEFGQRAALLGGTTPFAGGPLQYPVLAQLLMISFGLAICAGSSVPLAALISRMFNVGWAAALTVYDTLMGGGRHDLHCCRKAAQL